MYSYDTTCCCYAYKEKVTWTCYELRVPTELSKDRPFIYYPAHPSLSPLSRSFIIAAAHFFWASDQCCYVFVRGKEGIYRASPRTTGIGIPPCVPDPRGSSETKIRPLLINNRSRRIYVVVTSFFVLRWHRFGIFSTVDWFPGHTTYCISLLTCLGGPGKPRKARSWNRRGFKSL